MPKSPPFDEQGNVIAHDHDEIDGRDIIIRRISDKQIVTKNGQKHVSSIAYKASTGVNGYMSTDIEAFIIQNNLDPEKWVTSPRWIGSVKFSASCLRNKNLQVGYVPLEKNPYHGGVWGVTRSITKALQEEADWYVKIANVNLT